MEKSFTLSKNSSSQTQGIKKMRLSPTLGIFICLFGAMMMESFTVNGESDIRLVHLTDQFSVQWKTMGQFSKQKVQIGLDFVNLNVSSWKTLGNNGVWLAVGYGSQTHSDVDITLCKLQFTGILNKDKFDCQDYYSDSEVATTKDTIQNVQNLGSSALYSDDQSIGNFSVWFERNLTSNDTDQDYIMLDAQSLDGIWAYGQLGTNYAIQTHGTTTKSRGTWRLQLISQNNPNTSQNAIRLLGNSVICVSTMLFGLAYLL